MREFVSSSLKSSEKLSEEDPRGRPVTPNPPKPFSAVPLPLGPTPGPDCLCSLLLRTEDPCLLSWEPAVRLFQ